LRTRDPLDFVPVTREPMIIWWGPPWGFVVDMIKLPLIIIRIGRTVTFLNNTGL